MTAATRSVADFTPELPRFPFIPGFTIRGDFAGEGIASDLGALVLAANSGQFPQARKKIRQNTASLD